VNNPTAHESEVLTKANQELGDVLLRTQVARTSLTRL